MALTGIESKFIGTFFFDGPDDPVQLVPMTHFHIGDSFIDMSVDPLRPAVGFVDNLPCFLFAVLNSALCIAFRLQYPLDGLLSTRVFM